MREYRSSTVSNNERYIESSKEHTEEFSDVFLEDEMLEPSLESK